MSTPAPEPISTKSIGLALLVVLGMRLAHLRFAIAGPLTWQLGPDEEFYRQFGLDVAFGSWGLTERFAFMDPLYGYLVGIALKLAGGLFPLYLLQILVDCATAFGLYLVARELKQPRLGLIAILVYAVTGTAIAYTMTLLKATWVACYVVYWIYGALVLVRSHRVGAWALFGVWCGVGVALRANLLLLVPLGLVALAWLRWRDGERRPATLAKEGGALLAGLMLPLLLLAARNHAISGTFTPMPNNGGVVLHQLYNAENPESRAGAPGFVSRYSVPDEIWLGYKREAERRTGHALTGPEVSSYWRAQALDYMFANPAQDVRNALRKLGEFTAYREVPNTRNYDDERLVSPVLNMLPLPFGWLFALGLPGLAWLVWNDRRAVLLVVPLLMGAVTVAVFFAEDRFRFNVIAPFVLGTAAWLHVAFDALRERHWRRLGLGAAVSLLLAGCTIVQGQQLQKHPSDWRRMAWGYLKSGNRDKADEVLSAVAMREPQAVGLAELRGYLALNEHRYAEAATYYKIALDQVDGRHEVWHNYSVALEHAGNAEEALVAARRAYGLLPDEEYRARVDMLAKARAMPRIEATAP